MLKYGYNEIINIRDLFFKKKKMTLSILKKYVKKY